MPDYIYLLENRLSADQQSALRHLREAAREAEMILFLTGDAVRDLTSGHAVRDIEVAVTGNAFDLKKVFERTPVQVWGEDQSSGSLFLCFPGTVRIDVVSTHRTEYPKPGQPVFHQASIQEDLRRRDFTVNAMAISLNEGSFGLLMDPLNGAADIEARTLRLVSNYGFLEEPALLIRATRYVARLGWELDPKTQVRYENAKSEGVIEFLSAHARSQELEQIGHEDDGLKVLQALETEGWMKALYPSWTPSKADEEKLKALHSLAVDLLVQGVHADTSAAQMQLLTAKLPSKELTVLKKLLLRPGFVEEWNSLDSLASGFAKVLLAKENQTPSASFKLFTSYDPEAVLWLGFTSKDSAVKERFNQFLKVWPETRQRIPYALMQEMRIKPELPNYNEIVQSIFLQLIDDRLATPEEMRAFLEPHSPPAPPPQVTIKRTRTKRGAEPKIKDSFDEDEEESEDGLEGEDDLDDMGGDDDEIGTGIGIPKIDLEPDTADEGDADDSDEDEEEATEEEPIPAKRGAKGAGGLKASRQTPASSVLKAETHAAALSADFASGRESKPHAASKPEPESAHALKPGARPAPPVNPVGAASKPSPAARPTNHSHPKSAQAHPKAQTSPASRTSLESHSVKTGKPATAKTETKKPPAKATAKSTAKVPTKAPPAKPGVAKSHSSHPMAVKSTAASTTHKPFKPVAKKPAHKKH
jgi:tRNA nucleotidyltransferase (CCA-adding enzyme)